MKKLAFAGVYTDSCCTEGHVKKDTAYCGYICSFVCNLLPFIKNSVLRLGSWSCRGTRLWVWDESIVVRLSVEKLQCFKLSETSHCFDLLRNV